MQLVFRYHLRHLAALVLLAATAVVLTACNRGPSAEALRADLAAHVENVLAPGLLELSAVTPVEATTLAGLERNQCVIGFKADVLLKRDHDFGAWDQANVLALTDIFGAKPEDISGLKIGGNRSGDVIHIEGAALYARDNDTWKFSGGLVREPEGVPATGRGAVLSEFWRLGIATARAVVFTSQAPVVRDELIAATARMGRLEARLAVASGPAASDTWSVGDAARRQRAGSGAPFINLATKDSIESLRLLHEGKVTAAIIRNDEAALASAGTGPFEHGGTFPDLRALGSLFPEQVHVMVMAASSMASVADLYGKRLGVAATGPGSMSEAIDVLRAHRVAVTSLAAAPEERPLAAALTALEKGEFDAVIITAAAPFPPLRAFAAGHSVRLLPLDGDAIAVLTAGTSSYIATTVQPRTYDQQSRPIATVAVTAQLVALASTSAAEIDALLKLMFTEVDYPHHGSAVGALIERRSAATGVTLPMHVGTEPFFAGAPQK